VNAPFRIGTPVAALESVCWPVKPIASESIASLVLRSGDHNAVRKLGKLLQDAGLPSQQRCGRLPISSHPIANLATLLGVTEDWILERRHPVVPGERERITYYGATVRRAHLDYDARAWGAKALSLSPHVREGWTVSTLPVDRDTWEILAIRCPAPACGAPLGWTYTLGVERCEHCREDLTAATSPMLEQSFRASITCVLELLSTDPEESRAALDRMPEILRSEDRGDLFELVWLLGCLRNRIDYESVASPRLLDASMRLRVLAEGYDLISGWPASPVTLFRDGIENDRPDEVNDLVVRFRRLITRRATLGRASELLDQVMPGVRNHGMITMLAEAFGYVTTRQLANSSKVGESAVLQLREKGLIESKIIRRTADRAYALYPSNTASELIGLVSGRTTAATAANALGISIAGVAGLVDAKLLERETSLILATIFSDLLVSGTSLEELRTRLGTQLQPEMTEGAIALRQALRALPAGHKPWVAIVSRLVDGSLPLHRSSPDLKLRSATIHVDHVPLLVALAGQVLNSGSSFEFVDELDAREILSCTGRQLRALMAMGKLRSSGRYSGNTFRMNDLEQIGSEVISAGEARERGRLAGQRVYKALFHKGGLFKAGQQWADRAAFDALIAVG